MPIIFGSPEAQAILDKNKRQKPCPFCGSGMIEHDRDINAHVCETCGTIGPTTGRGYTWNNRQPEQHTIEHVIVRHADDPGRNATFARCTWDFLQELAAKAHFGDTFTLIQFYKGDHLTTIFNITPVRIIKANFWTELMETQ